MEGTMRSVRIPIITTVETAAEMIAAIEAVRQPPSVPLATIECGTPAPRKTRAATTPKPAPPKPKASKRKAKPTTPSATPAPPTKPTTPWKPRVLPPTAPPTFTEAEQCPSCHRKYIDRASLDRHIDATHTAATTNRPDVAGA